MRIGALGAALAGVLVTSGAGGCRAAQPDYLSYRRMTVPFDGLRVHDDPSTPYRELVQRLRLRAANEASDRRDRAAVSVRPWGRNGERMLVAAITPARGVFYYTEYGPYPLRGGPVVTMPRGELDVCRFTVDWDRLPGGAYAPGLMWAGVVFPGLDCTPPSREAVVTIAAWRRNSASASYRVAAIERRSGLVAWLVEERWTGNARSQPLDAGRAVAAVGGARDPVVRAIPVSDDQPLYAVTRGGRTFIGLTTSDESALGRVCIVAGVAWAEIATPGGHPRMRAARELCTELLRRRLSAESSSQPRG